MSNAPILATVPATAAANIANGQNYVDQRAEGVEPVPLQGARDNVQMNNAMPNGSEYSQAGSPLSSSNTEVSDNRRLLGKRDIPKDEVGASGASHTDHAPHASITHPQRRTPRREPRVQISPQYGTDCPKPSGARQLKNEERREAQIRVKVDLTRTRHAKQKIRERNHERERKRRNRGCFARGLEPEWSAS